MEKYHITLTRLDMENLRDTVNNLSGEQALEAFFHYRQDPTDEDAAFASMDSIMKFYFNSRMLLKVLSELLHTDLSSRDS